MWDRLTILEKINQHREYNKKFLNCGKKKMPVAWLNSNYNTKLSWDLLSLDQQNKISKQIINKSSRINDEGDNNDDDSDDDDDDIDNNIDNIIKYNNGNDNNNIKNNINLNNNNLNSSYNNNTIIESNPAKRNSSQISGGPITHGKLSIYLSI
jgi:hypothetical protein